jgi:hypothetical protein
MTVVRVVDTVPAVRSDETELNWQSSIAINPANPNEIVVTAYREPPNNIGYSYSYDRGQNWQMNFSEPGEQLDQSAGFGATGELYWTVAFLPPTDTPTLHVLLTPDPSTAGPLPEIDTPRPEIDQPYAHVFTHGEPVPPDKDRVYVGYVDRSHNMGASAIATVDVCLDARAPAPIFIQVPVDFRAPLPLDGYEVRPSAHSDGKVYVAFKSWNSWNGTTVITDVVVVRDDNWGSGGFVSLKDLHDGQPGQRVATSVHIKDPQYLGGQRLDNDLSIAVDPTNSATAYIVWGDNAQPQYTLRVRRTLDWGQSWGNDLLTVANANLAGLAINSEGRVGFIYQQLVSGLWETHFRRTQDNTGKNWDDIVLARTPTAGSIADYSRVVAVGRDFYGVFPAWNTPDPANFPATPPTSTNPNGARFLRKTTKTAPWQLLGSGGVPVAESVDPFFYVVLDESTPNPPTDLIATAE